MPSFKEYKNKEDISSNVVLSSKDVIDGIIKPNIYLEKINGFFDASNKGLVSLENSPNNIAGAFYCDKNKLTTLIGGPSNIRSNFECQQNTKLTSLIGAPNFVGGDVLAWRCGITSLEGIGKKYLKQINGKLDVDFNPITSHVLGILLIRNLQEFSIRGKSNNFYTFNALGKVNTIVNNHLSSNNKDILECQEELISNNLKEYAKL